MVAESSDTSEPGSRVPVAAIALAALGIRAAVLLIALLATITFYPPPNTPPEQRSNPVVELPNRWDARWYVGIASGGYRRSTDEVRWSNLVFFPAYPVALGIVARALRVPQTPAAWAWVGVLLSTIAFAWAAVFVYRIAQRWSSDSAEFSLALLAAYPFALFFGGVYTESFFLLGSTGAFWHFGQRSFGRAAVWGLFTGLVRPNGMLLAVPLLLWALIRDRQLKGRSRWLAGLAFASPVVGASVYAAYVWSITGDPLMWATAQEGWGRNYVGLTGAARQIVSAIGSLTLRPFDFLNASAALLALISIIPAGRRLGWPAAAFIALNLLPPLLVGGLVSLGRFTSVLFPLHIWAATAIPPRLRWAVLMVFALGQGLLAALHYASYPVF